MPQNKQDDPYQGNDLLHKILDELPFIIFCKDYQSGSGHYIFWNNQAENFWGQKKSMVLGSPDAFLFPAERADNIRKEDLKILRSGERVLNKEALVESPVFGVVQIRTWKIPILDVNGQPRYLLGICQDLTDIKNLENDIKNLTGQAQTAAGLIYQAQVAKHIAHEFNNPLAIIMGRANQLKRMINVVGSIDEMELAVESIIETVQRSSRSVSLILDLYSGQSLPEVTEEDFVKKQIDLFHDLVNLIAIAQGKAKQAKRLLQNADLSGTNAAALIEEKVNASLEALARMTVRLEHELSASRKRANQNKENL